MGDGTFGSERLWSYANVGATVGECQKPYSLMTGQIYIKRSSLEPDATSDHRYGISAHKQTYTHSRLSKKISKHIDGNIFGLNINIPDAHA